MKVTVVMHPDGKSARTVQYQQEVLSEPYPPDHDLFIYAMHLKMKELEQQLAAKDALLRQALDAFLQFTSRESMDDLESFGYSADAVIAAIDKDLKQ